MKTKQTMSVRISPWIKKSSASGEIPLYAVVTISGEETSISLGEKIPGLSAWDPDQKIMKGSSERAIRTNFKISDIKSALNDHFLVLCTLHEVVTSVMVKKAYLGKEHRLVLNKAARKETTSLSLRIDELIPKLVRELKKTKNPTRPMPWLENAAFQQELKTLISSSNRFFDDLTIPKTLINAMDEWLVRLIERTNKGITSIETLRRWPVTKNKLKAFLAYRYQSEDIKLLQVEFKFAEQFYNYLTATDNVGHNASMKHVKNVKQLLDRAIVNSWIKVNPIKHFRCTYREPDQEGIVMREIQTLMNTNFDDGILGEVRDMFIFCCFTGYAYQDVKALSRENIITGIDGKQWLSTRRNKTGEKEDVPILPIAASIIAKYQTHPLCLQRNSLLPVRANQLHNRCLKRIAAICGIKRDLTTHIARHTFATTVTLENDVPLPTVQKMLGHKSIRTTEKYARASRLKVSRNMQQLTEKLFAKDGNLISNDRYYQIDPQPEIRTNGGLRVAYKDKKTAG